MLSRFSELFIDDLMAEGGLFPAYFFRSMPSGLSGFLCMERLFLFCREQLCCYVFTIFYDSFIDVFATFKANENGSERKHFLEFVSFWFINLLI